MNNNTKILFNTGVLYVKMLITMVFTLLSTRWVLEALGESDYGLYNLVAGLIAMFSFLNTAMAVATQRNLSFSLGKNDHEELQTIFYSSVVLHITLALIIVLFIEVGGYFAVLHYLNIPEGRESVALILLHTMSASTLFTIIDVPFVSALNAHEDMIVIALVNIFEAVWKFVLALYLLTCQYDRLIIYSLLLMLMSAISLVIKIIFCRKHYPETHFKSLSLPPMDTVKYLLSYTSWNIVGALGILVKGQGIAILYNRFFGVNTNAAYGVASQVNGQLSFFSNSIIRAFNPQIIKSEGEGDHSRMIRLSCMSCKISTFLMLVIIVPIMYNLHLILNLWLKDVPADTESFTFIILASAVFYQMYHGFELSIHADGRIKLFSIVSCIINIAVIPVGYIILKFGAAKEMVLIISLISTLLNMFNVAYFSEKYNRYRLWQFVKDVFIPLTVIFTVSCVTCHVLSSATSEVLSLLVSFILNLIVSALLFYIIALNKDEKTTLNNMLNRVVEKILKK